MTLRSSIAGIVDAKIINICTIVGKGGTPPMESPKRAVVVPRWCPGILGQLRSLFTMMIWIDVDEYLQSIYRIFTVDLRRIYSIFADLYREYEGLSQKLSTTLVTPHIGIATIFAKD
jgi:hypothetical protein